MFLCVVNRHGGEHTLPAHSGGVSGRSFATAGLISMCGVWWRLCLRGPSCLCGRTLGCASPPDACLLWGIFGGMRWCQDLPVNPNDRKYRAGSDDSALGQEATCATLAFASVQIQSLNAAIPGSPSALDKIVGKLAVHCVAERRTRRRVAKSEATNVVLPKAMPLPLIGVWYAAAEPLICSQAHS
jgi:hypothetical protein